MSNESSALFMRLLITLGSSLKNIFLYIEIVSKAAISANIPKMCLSPDFMIRELIKIETCLEIVETADLGSNKNDLLRLLNNNLEQFTELQQAVSLEILSERTNEINQPSFSQNVESIKALVRILETSKIHHSSR